MICNFNAHILNEEVFMNCETCGSSYTDDVMDHFQNPRNSGYLVDADGEGKTGDPECGDHIVISIKVRNQRIALC